MLTRRRVFLVSARFCHSLLVSLARFFWYVTSLSVLQKYQKQAEKDKKRYQAELAEYNQ
jgi:hypothetical protein